MRGAKRSRRAVLFDSLERRELLSGVSAPTAEVHMARTSRVALIQGTITGKVTLGPPSPDRITIDVSDRTFPSLVFGATR
jgi:hypothetical protein